MRIQEILDYYAEELYRGERSRATYDRCREGLEQANPYSVNRTLHGVIERHPDMDKLKVPVARFLRACASALEKEPPPDYPSASLPSSLTGENRLIEEHLGRVSSSFKTLMAESDQVPSLESRSALGDLLIKPLELLKEHYTRLQNELFPALEAAAPEYRCIALMWSIQDDVLASGRELGETLRRADLSDMDEVNILMGRFFLDAKSLIWREEQILYPVAFRYISHLYNPEDRNTERGAEKDGFTCPTGTLSGEELEAMFRTLPVDITFVDKEEKVRFFSDTPDRIFPRHPAILGREVKNCHPPKSVDQVERIVEELKSGKKDSERFWLQVKGRMVLIEYYALRTAEGEFLGVMEASRDITEARSLEGEKRL